METNDPLTRKVIGLAMAVHRELGPGLLESAYQTCLAHELTLAGMAFCQQRPLPVVYKGLELDCAYRLDMVVEDSLLLELKAVESLLPIHHAQLLTYLKLSKLELGLLMNFNVPVLKDGIKRVIRTRDRVFLDSSDSH